MTRSSSTLSAILLGLPLLLAGLPSRLHAGEFRGAWVATVWNIDWPSRPGLTTASQQKELKHIFAKAKDIGLNAIIFQVRPAGDTFYQSPFEPWSAFLTGKMGRPPEPFYDPLKFAIEEAHKRGLKLHAWINPFRLKSGNFAPTPNHLRRTHPEWVVRCGKEVWLDPGIRDVQTYTIQVIQDLIQRYDLDGIHIDDYFYPYPPDSMEPKKQNFDDWDSFTTYRKHGGKLSRNAWRRSNINTFVKDLYHAIKKTDPHVLLGISPFGIWRPGHPKTIQADLDAYEVLCADSRLWLQEGWCDYFSPQLYWRIDQKDQSFPVLLKWWNEQNTKGVLLWPGIATDRIGRDRSPDEIVRQINITRNILKMPGHIHWSFSALNENRGEIDSLLKREAY